MALRTVGVRLQAEVSGYVNSLRTAQRATRDFASDLDKAAREGKLDAVADQAGRMGLAMTAAAGLVVGAAARFDKAMSSVQAATLASAGEMELLRQAAIDAGRDTAYSATEAAGAIEELAKAGVSTADILGGGLRGALDLAAAGQIDVAEAAEVAASAMTQFRLRGSDVAHVADLLAAGAGKAQGSVRDLGMALSQGGLVAAQMGLSVEDTTGTLAAFASAGLMGSDAGTSLKTALLMLANPTDQARRLMQELGIRVYDANGQFVGIVELAGQLQSRLGTLTQEQRNAALATIFGADAIRSASILYEQGADGIQAWIDKVNDQGYAAETARQKTDNLIGDLERLRGELETLAIQAGSSSSGGLRMVVQAVEALVSQVGSLPPAVSGSVVALAGLTGGALLLSAAWVKTRRANAEMLAELRATGPMGERAARGLQTAQRAAARTAVAFAALQVAGALLASTQKDLNPQIEAVGKGLEEWGRGGQLAGEAARVLGADMVDLGTGLKFLADTDNDRRVWARRLQDSLETLIPGLSSTDTSLARTRERVAAVDQALAAMVQGGRATAAADVFDRMAAAAAADGVSVDELRKLMPQYAAALEVAGSATGKTADATGELGGAAAAAAADVQALKDAFDRLFGVQMSYDRAVIAAKQGLADLKEELLDGARSLSINSAEGLKNRSAVLDQIDAIEQLRQARIDHGMALKEADALYVKDIDGLKKVMLQAGFTKGEIDALLGAYREIPEKVQTQVGAPGAQESERKVRNYNFAIGQVPDSKTTKITAETAAAMARARALAAYLRNIPDEHVNVAIRITGASPSAAAAAIRAQYANRWGGLYEGPYKHAQIGILREAEIASPAAPARYAWAEPATGGELFAPRNGDFNRTRSLVSYAVENWWGGWGRFVPGSAMPANRAGGPSGPVTYDNRINVYPQRAELTIRDLEALEARRDALARVGRPR